MNKPCETCKHQKLTARDEPCRNCVNLEGYEPREITKDSKQIYLELLMMYIKALNNCEGIDELFYEVQKDRFMNLLGEFQQVIRIEEREECW